jgi:antibiotic biosynthesis monooxygenase (ABM) superfamily enzyme
MANEANPLTVVITRSVRPGCEEVFESTLKDWIPRLLAFPGHLGVHMFRPSAGSREYAAVLKFRTQAAWDMFRQAPQYLEFLATIRPFLEGESRVETECGLESWFTPPGKPLRPLPRWKMALVTLCGVYPTSLLLGQTIGRWTSDWHFLLSAFVFATLMVGLLTWVVMPLLTRLLHPWLHPEERRALP